MQSGKNFKAGLRTVKLNNLTYNCDTNEKSQRSFSRSLQKIFLPKKGEISETLTETEIEMFAAEHKGILDFIHKIFVCKNILCLPFSTSFPFVL